MKFLRLTSVYLLSVFFLLIFNCKPKPHYDIVIRNGLILDGTGVPGYKGDVAISGDTIAALGNLESVTADLEIDATRLIVAPGFINMLSWANEDLIADGNSQSDIRQGVTLEVFGEGWSMGPLGPEIKERMAKQQGDIKYDIEWTTLNEYLEFLERKGVSTNVASFLGATTLRINTVGYEDREATPEELEEMKEMVRRAMEEGALGIGSSLIYAPAFYSTTEELIEICKVASEYDGMYISHIRSEGVRLLESLDELLRIADEADIRAEVYHLKQSGKVNWNKFELVKAKIDSARNAGLHITTDMYNYTAGATGLDAAMPPWVQEGGYEKWAERLQDPESRKKVLKEMKEPARDWESLMQMTEGPDQILLIGFKNDSLKYLTGKSLAEVAEMRGTSPEETAMDLVIQDGSRVGTVYFLMSEENVKKQIALPYMSFGSDAGSMAPEGVFLKSSTHPRAYGNFARLLGKYVRDEKVIPMEEAIYKLSGLPASNLKIKRRGNLKTGYFADLAIFDPEKIQDNATYEEPQKYATGMVHVFVNGQQVLKNGEHTGAQPGRVVRGPGYGGSHSLSPEINEDTLTKRIRTIQQESGLVGLGAAVVDTSGIRYAHGFGFADKEKEIPYTENSIQTIASISKTFIGISLLKAQEMGYLNLDDPVNKYLPFEVFNPKHPDKPITLRQLSCHTSSIQDTDTYDERSYVLRKSISEDDKEKLEANENFNDPAQAVSMDEFFKRVLTREGLWYSEDVYLDSEPGTKFEYSNVAAALTAYALEQATQSDYREFTRKHILEPLEMNDSGWGFDKVNMDQHSVLYSENQTPYPLYRLITYPDGGLISSVSDLGKYLNELINGYNGKGTILTPQSYEELFQPQLGDSYFEERDPDNPYNDEYDMGIFMGISGQGNIGHTGGDPGVSTFMFFNEESLTGQVVFLNTSLSQESFDSFVKIWTALEQYRSEIAIQGQ
jgi:N-acyl-D-amino-acid deacylase